MMRKLSSIEHMIDGNIVYFVRLAGNFPEQQLRTSIARLQYKHPVLRMLIRVKRDGLYYEYDCAPSIPLRILPRLSEDDYHRNSTEELRVRFSHDQPQLRVVWLQGDREQDLLFVASHRICDGMSMLTIVREVLRYIYKDEMPVPYQPISPDHIIGDYRAPHPVGRRMMAHLSNAILSLIPESRKEPGNREFCLEWSAGREMSDALRQRCRSEAVSVHAALTTAFDRALLAVLGKPKMPAWIESPMDARRGRLSILESDMLFFGGGSLNLRTGRNAREEFWDRVRSVHSELREMIELELTKIPGRYQFFGMLRPLSDARIHTMVRIADALHVNGSWNRIALSNLGNVVVTEPGAPFQLIDLRLYVHSFNIRLLGLVSYLLNGEMRFYFVGDEKCMSCSQAEAVQERMMALLQDQIPASIRCAAGTPTEVRSLAGMS
jgi:hypothetical protein